MEPQIDGDEQYEDYHISFERFRREVKIQEEIRSVLLETGFDILEFAWKLVGNFWVGLVHHLAFLAFVAGALLVVGGLLGLMFGAGTLGMAITGSGNEVFEAGNNIGMIGQSFANTFLSDITTFLGCQEIVLETYNEFMRIVLATLYIVADKINDVLGLGIQPLPFWWTQARRVERALKKYDDAINHRWAMTHLDGNRSVMMRVLPAENLPAYFRAMRNKALGIMRDLRQVNKRDVISALCDISTAIFKIIYKLTSIFGDALITLFNIIDDSFHADSFDDSFIGIIVKLIIKYVLLNFPLIECLVNKDDLSNTPVSGLPALFVSQLPSHIIACGCNRRYVAPSFLNSGPKFSNATGGDPVPNNFGAALVICTCPFNSFAISTGFDVVTAIRTCYSIDSLVNQFINFDIFVDQNFKVQLAGLQTDFTKAYNDILDLKGKVDKLLKQVFGLRAIMRSLRMLPAEDPDEEFAQYMRSLPKRQYKYAFETSNFTISPNMSPYRPPALSADGLFWNGRSEIGFSDVMDEAQRVAKMLRNPEATRTFWSELKYELVQQAAKRSVHADFIRVVDELDNPELREHIARAGRAVSQYGTIVMDAFEKRTQMDELIEQMEYIDVGGILTAIDKMYEAVLRKNGKSIISPYQETILRAAPATLLFPKEFPRVYRELRNKFGNDTAVNEGLRSLRNFPGLADALAQMDEELPLEITKLQHENREATKRMFAHVPKEYVPRAQRDPRDTVFSINADGESFTAFLSIFGFAFTSLSALGVIGFACCVPLFGVSAACFPFIIALLGIIVAGGMSNFLTNAESGNGIELQYDFFSPYIAALETSLHDVFIQGFSESILSEATEQTIEITKNHVFMVINLFIRNLLCNFPIPLGTMSCPRMPRIDSTGNPDEDPWDYVIAIVTAPQDRDCPNPAACDDNECVSRDNPSRLCTYEQPCYPLVNCPLTGHLEICIPIQSCSSGIVQCQIQNCNAPDLASIICPDKTTYGQCNAWPLLRERVAPPTLEFNLYTKPDCMALMGIDLNGKIRYFDQISFKEHPFGRGWFFSWDFVDYLLQGSRFTLSNLQLASRTILHAPEPPKIGIFSWFGQFFFFFIPGVFQYTSMYTIGKLSFRDYMDWTADTIISVGEFIEDVPILSLIPIVEQTGTEITKFARSPNWQTFPPYGTFESPGGLALCGAIALPVTLQVIPIWAFILIIVLGLIVSGLLFFYLHLIWAFVLMFVGYVLVVGTVFYRSIELHQLRVLDHEREPEHPLGRAMIRIGTALPMQRGHFPRMARQKHGFVARNAVRIGSGLVAQLHANVNEGERRGYWSSLMHAVLTAGRASFHLISIEGLKDLAAYRAWKRFKTNKYSHAVFDHMSPREAYSGFPYPHYIFDSNNVRMDHDNRILIMPEKTLYGRHTDEHFAEYEMFH